MLQKHNKFALNKSNTKTYGNHKCNKFTVKNNNGTTYGG